MDELTELKQEIVLRWADTHKKSMMTFLILVCLANEPKWSREIAEWIETTTNWQTNERSLYRTLQRMADNGLIEYVKVQGRRTGADRKQYALSNLGRQVASDIQRDVLSYERSDRYISNLRDIR